MKTPRVQTLIEFVLDNFFEIATIVVASGLVIWYQIFPPSASQVAEIATWILAVLALLAISGLWERNRKLRRIEKLSEEGRDLAQRYLSKKVYASDFFLNERPLSDKDFSSAHTIYLVGLTLTRTSREFLYIFGQRLLAGATIRFIIIDPESETVLHEIESRSFEAPSKYWGDTLKTVETVIEALAKTPNSKGKVEVGYLPFVPAFGLTIIEPNQTHGKCIVELYQHKSAAPHATFELQASEDQYWYKYFVDQFDTLWSSCRIRSFETHQ